MERMRSHRHWNGWKKYWNLECEVVTVTRFRSGIMPAVKLVSTAAAVVKITTRIASMIRDPFRDLKPKNNKALPGVQAAGQTDRQTEQAGRDTDRPIVKLPTRYLKMQCKALQCSASMHTETQRKTQTQTQRQTQTQSRHRADTDGQRQRQRERERERQRQRQKQTDRQIPRQTDRFLDRQTDRFL